MTEKLSASEVIENLDLPPWLNDVPLLHLKRGESFLRAFDPDGQRLSEDLILGDLQINHLRRGDLFLQAELTGNGETVWINTTYLGSNHNYWGGPPLIWESLIAFSNAGDLIRRYAHEAAARAGHRKIILTLIEIGMTLAAPADWP